MSQNQTDTKENLHTPVFSKILSSTITTIPIDIYTELQDGSKIKIGIATAYCEKYEDNYFLITNWHCVTGREPSTGQPKAADGVVPTHVVAHFHHVSTREDGKKFLSPGSSVEMGFPTQSDWIMHQNGQSVDIAAIRIPVRSDLEFASMRNVVGLYDPRIQVGDEVFIIGFPRGVMPTGTIPIWKRASIATEPSLPAFNEPCFLVDSATREGMSGSPVVAYATSARHYPHLAVNSGEITPETILLYKPGLAFLGIYSGRIGVGDLFEAQIGKVWYASVIDEMLANPRTLDWEMR